MSETLKPCPFCGSTKLEGRGKRDDGRALWIACTSCDATGPTILKSVEEDWNTRAHLPVQPAGAEPIGCPLPGACSCPSALTPNQRAAIICDFMGWPEDGPAWKDAHKLAAQLAAPSHPHVAQTDSLTGDELTAAWHELICCDDISLSGTLADGISQLQADRERLRASLTGDEPVAWRASEAKQGSEITLWTVMLYPGSRMSDIGIGGVRVQVPNEALETAWAFANVRFSRPPQEVAPSAKSEPIAWIGQGRGERVFTSDPKAAEWWKEHGFKVTPLYARSVDGGGDE